MSRRAHCRLRCRRDDAGGSGRCNGPLKTSALPRPSAPWSKMRRRMVKSKHRQFLRGHGRRAFSLRSSPKGVGHRNGVSPCPRQLCQDRLPPYFPRASICVFSWQKGTKSCLGFLLFVASITVHDQDPGSRMPRRGSGMYEPENSFTVAMTCVPREKPPSAWALMITNHVEVGVRAVNLLAAQSVVVEHLGVGCHDNEATTEVVGLQALEAVQRRWVPSFIGKIVRGSRSS